MAIKAPTKKAAPKLPPPRKRTTGEQRLGITYQKGNNPAQQNILERAGRLIDAIDAKYQVPNDGIAHHTGSLSQAKAAAIILQVEVGENVHRARNAAFAAIEKAAMLAYRCEQELARLPKK